MNGALADTIAAQLAEITATSEDGMHLLQVQDVDILVNENHTRVVSPRTGAAYLHVGEWGSSHPCFIHPDCVLPEHVADLSPIDEPDPVDDPVHDAVDKAIDKVDNEDEEDRLVRAASRPTLASLYKNARSKGLVPASPASGASGYF